MRFDDIKTAGFLSEDLKQTEEMLELVDESKVFESSINVERHGGSTTVTIAVGFRSVEVPKELIGFNFREIIKAALEGNREEKKKRLMEMGVEVA